MVGMFAQRKPYQTNYHAHTGSHTRTHFMDTTHHTHTTTYSYTVNTQGAAPRRALVFAAGLVRAPSVVWGWVGPGACVCGRARGGRVCEKCHGAMGAGMGGP